MSLPAYSLIPNLQQQFFKAMKGIKLNTNFAVFLLFFGAAALEAFQSRNWMKAVFWLGIGIFFLLSDNLKKV